MLCIFFVHEALTDSRTNQNLNSQEKKMRKTILALAALITLNSSVFAIEPLKADLNPANYIPNQSYFDTGSGQYFYYDAAQNTFFVSLSNQPYSITPQQVGAATQLVQSYGYDLHSIAYARAAAMAALDMFFPNHAIPNAPGIPGNVSEGIGMGGPNCATCVMPGSIVADAEVLSVSGRVYRVRFFQ